MSNGVRYSISPQNKALRKGNFSIATGEIIGPTEVTGFYSGVDLPTNGYVMYINKESQGPSIYQIPNETSFLEIVKSISGNTYTTIAECLAWVSTQSDIMVVNKTYPNLVIDGLVLSLDASFVPSYPKTGNIWYDISSNSMITNIVNNATFNSSGWISFDGINDYVNANNIRNYIVGNVDLTVSFLINYNFFIDTFDCFLGVNTSTGDNRFLLGVGTSGAITFNKNGINDLTNTGRISAGKWYSIVASNSTTGIPKLFVNGILIPEIDNVSTITFSNNDTWTVCAEYDSSTIGDFSNAKVSSFQIYDRILSESEILQNYYQAPIVTEGLVLALDPSNLVSYENGATGAYSLIGNSTATLTNGVEFSTDNGGAWQFDGVDDYINISSDGLGDTFTSFSIEIIVNPSAGAGADTIGYILHRSTTSIVGSSVYSIHMGGSSINFSINGGNTIQITNSAGILAHYVYTWDGSTTRLYKNGTLVNSISFSTFTNTRAGSFTNIGATSINPGYRPLAQTFYSLKIYNSALDLNQVIQNFNAQRSRFGI